MFQRMTSLFLSLLMTLITLFPAMQGAQRGKEYDGQTPALESLDDYLAYFEGGGAPALDTDTFLRAAKPITVLRRLLTGKIILPEEESFLSVSIDETIEEMCSYFNEAAGVDVAKLLGHIPDNNALAELCVGVFHLDTKAFRQEIYAKRDQAKGEGKGLLSAALYIFGVYFSIIDDVKIYTTPYQENPEERIVTLDVTFRDGETQTMYAYLVFDPETGLVHSEDEKGVLKFGLDVNLYDVLLWSTVNSWQRNFGYSILYDLFADSVPTFNFLTRRFKFEYDDRDWMIQIWKGNYALVTNGAEFGVYHRDYGKHTGFYQTASDDEMLPMSIAVYHGEELLLEKGPERHWWQSAFKLSHTIYRPQDLTLKFSITLADEDMLAAFTEAIDRHPLHDVAYTVEGLTLTGIW